MTICEFTHRLQLREIIFIRSASSGYKVIVSVSDSKTILYKFNIIDK